MAETAPESRRGIHRMLFGTWFGVTLDDRTIEAIVAGWSHNLAGSLASHESPKGDGGRDERIGGRA